MQVPPEACQTRLTLLQGILYLRDSAGVSAR